jgi:hypothetical protein
MARMKWGRYTLPEPRRYVLHLDFLHRNLRLRTADCVLRTAVCLIRKRIIIRKCSARCGRPVRRDVLGAVSLVGGLTPTFL